MDYEAVIGLEIHIQLNSPTKMFCDCPNRPGDPPNRNTCPICLWLPGAVPLFSGDALERAALAALALNCELQERSAFDQKVYYYPDLPKGFQLSQAHQPLALNGWLEIPGESGRAAKVRVRKVHMEEDVARLVHAVDGRTPVSLVDFNRAGSPLVEIVTEPDLRGPRESMEFIRALRSRIRYAGCSECNLEQGSMRVDANVSLRPRGSEQLNTKVEIKNMNSIHHLGEAIAYEIERQKGGLEAGEEISLHTRLWDPDRRVTLPMRGKFEGPCIPDPAVPAVLLTAERRARLKAMLPEMPDARLERFMGEYGLGRAEAARAAAERDGADYFEAVVRDGAAPQPAVHWIFTQLAPVLKQRGQSFADTAVTPQRLSALLALLAREEIGAGSAREVLAGLFESDRTPQELVSQGGCQQVSDGTELEALVERVLAANPAAAADFRAGQSKALGFLIGQAMQASEGKANPKRVRERLLKKLS